MKKESVAIPICVKSVLGSRGKTIHSFRCTGRDTFMKVQGATQKVNKSEKRRYETHHNGGRPFFVEIDGKNVTVSKNMNTFKLVKGKFVDVEAPPKHLFTKKATEIFIGKKSPGGGYDGLKPSEAEGNSILLKLGANKYMFIGHEIYEFEPVAGDTIESYYSNIGNSDVPYPYAIGKTHVYIMLDKEAVEKSYFDMKKDIYEQFYFPQRVKDCKNGFGDKTICKDKDYVKERLKEFEAKRRRFLVRDLGRASS